MTLARARLKAGCLRPLGNDPVTLWSYAQESNLPSVAYETTASPAMLA